MRLQGGALRMTPPPCAVGGTGVFGKQTSALFVAVSKRIQFTDSELL